MCSPDSFPQLQDPCVPAGTGKGRVVFCSNALAPSNDTAGNIRGPWVAPAAHPAVLVLPGALLTAILEPLAGLPLLHLLCSKSTPQLPFGAVIFQGANIRETAGRVCGCALLCQVSCQRALCSHPSAPGAKPAVVAPTPLQWEGW